MTEIGHGSNVRNVGTIAEYDAEKQEFVINTPDDSARKFWIGNSYIGGNNTTVVFARLLLKGKDYGVHAFVTKVIYQNLVFVVVPFLSFILLHSLFH